MTRKASNLLGVCCAGLIGALLTAYLLWPTGNSTPSTTAPTISAATSSAPARMSIEEAKAALRKAPGWTPGKMSSDERARLVETIVEICRLETPMLREVVASFMDDLKPNKPDVNEVDEWSKIYILNRIAFDVPPEYPLGGGRDEIGFFGGWAGVPVDDRKVKLRWPVDYGQQGLVSITGEFGGYFGDKYQGVLEFDAFAERFERRK